MRTMQRVLARLRSDRGNVGVLMALFIMVAVGSLAMTWNTVQISKEKMRLQTAADSAALSACVWQARGMNAVQNLNDEMYIMLSLASKLLLIGTPIQTLGVSLWSARFTPFVGPVFSALAIVTFGVALLLGGTSAWMVALCTYMLSPLEIFYAKISPFLGFWGAQQLAARNGATRLLTATTESATNLAKTFGDLGIFAVGTSVPTSELLTLPLEELSGNLSKPWKHFNTVAKIKQTIKNGKKKTTFGAGDTKEMNADTWEVVDKDDLANSKEIKIDKEPVSEAEKAERSNIWRSQYIVPSPLASVHRLLGTGNPWAIKPIVSMRETEWQEGKKVEGDAILPKPVMFIVRRDSKYIETFDMTFWDKGFASRPAKDTPMLAVAAAQCITGDVVEHSKTPSEGANNRPAGFGTGATAKLIPISEYAKLRSDAGGVTKGVFH